MRVTIIGCGYVGLTTSTALAYIGHRVNCIDQNRDLIEVLQNGDVPLHEVGIKELLAEVRDRLTFGGWDSFDVETDIVIIAVGTPRKENGDADMTCVEAVAGELGRLLPGPGGRLPIIVNKSTVPIGYAQRVKSIISCRLRESGILTPVTVASNPEFLREGRALFDSFYPDRIIIGADDSDVADILCEMYMPIIKQTFNPLPYIKKPEDYSPPKPFITTPTNAELIKYASNAFLAVKISFINEIAGLSERVGANIKEVAGGIGLDRRIGAHYLNAGIGWGGSCFGKDVQAMLHTARQYGYEMPLSSAAVQVNASQREDVVRKLQAALKVLRGTTIGLLGLSFKPGTDDLRDAPSIAIASRLIELGVHVKVYDPVSMDNCRRIYPELELKYTAGVEELACEVDALVLVTEWDEFTRLPFSRLGNLMRNKIIIDGRNVLNAQELINSGFKYFGVGGMKNLFNYPETEEDISNCRFSYRELFIKRIFDMVVGFILLIVSLPLLFMFAVLIILDSKGPAFFIQKRLGRKGKVFDCYKFRTMVPDAEEVLSVYLKKDPTLKKEWETNFKLKNDPRLTRVGRILRRSSLDELPQIINVIRGEMSLVGPRPRPLYEVDGREEDYIFRVGLSVRPGMTGLWQVSGRNELDFQNRIRLDAVYAKNCSLWLDIYLILKTVGTVLRQKGAC